MLALGTPEGPTADQKPYRPYGTIRDLWAYQGREVLVAGPAGTGKSRGCLEKLHACAAYRYPGMRGLICRKVRSSLTQSALTTFNTKVLTESSVPFHHERGEYQYPNGSVIAIAGLDDPEKVKSSDYDLIYIQEATELDQEDWLILLTRLRNGVMPYQQLLADCNPGPPSHWLKERTDAGTLHLIESRHEDNPTLWDRALGTWTPGGRAYMAVLDSLTGYLYQRLRQGLWVAAEGMFFPEFDPDRHVIPARDLPADWARWTMTDWGWADPFCTLWCARGPAPDKRIYVYREIYAPGLRDEQQADLIRERSQGERISLHVGDPSMFNARTEQQRPSIARIYWQHGVQLQRADNARIAGWQTVRRALAWNEAGIDPQHPDRYLEARAPRLQIMRERCPNLIRTLPTMVHDPLNPEDLADKLGHKKTDDHAEDALRYGLQAEQNPPPASTTRARFGSKSV